MARLVGKFRQPRTQAALVLLFALLVGVGTYLYLLGYQARLDADSDLIPAYVAKTEIASGTSFGEINSNNLLELKEFPKKSLPIDAVTPTTQLDSSWKTRGVLSSGQIIVSNHFASETPPDIGLPIPKGMLAVTISVDDVSRVGNFVSPGSRVVIFSTNASSSGGSLTRVLLPEALVIGIGSQTTPSGNASLPTPSPLVTVALSPLDAQRLIQTSKTSQITLALAFENNPRSVIESISNPPQRIGIGG